MNAPSDPEPPIDLVQLTARLANPNDPERFELFSMWVRKPAVECAGMLGRMLDLGTVEAQTAVLEILRSRPREDAPLRTLWEQLAASPDEALRAQTLGAAGRLSPERAVALLPLWLEDSEPTLRRRALNRLAMTNRPEAVAVVTPYVVDEDKEVRRFALQILLAFPESIEAARALCRVALQGEADARRKALAALEAKQLFWALLAAASLVKSGAPDAALDGVQVFKQRDAAEAVDEICAGIEQAVVADVELPEAELCDVLGRMPRDVRDTLAERADAPAWLRRALVACDAAAVECDSGTARRLLRFAGDAELSLRARAIEALIEHARRDGLSILQPLLAHDDAAVRRRTVEGLRACGEHGATLLHATLSDPDAGVRRATYTTLAVLTPDETVRLWRRALKDASTELRLHAVDALAGLVEDAEARRGLAEAARDGEAEVRIAAVLALMELGEVVPSLAEAYREALGHLLSPAVRPKPAVRLVSNLVKAVAQLAPPGTLGALVAAAGHKSAAVRRAAVTAIEKLDEKTRLEALALLADTEDRGLLKRVAVALAKAEDPRGLIPVVRAQEECRSAQKVVKPLLEVYPQTGEIEFLMKALKNPWPSVKRFSLARLVDLDDPKLVDPLLQAAEDEDVEVQLAAVMALGKYAKEARVFERLIAFLDYGDTAVRQQACETLGDNQVLEAVEPLIRFLTNPFLKFRAEEALVRIGDRKGLLAIKRRKIRERLFGKKKEKGSAQSSMPKGKRILNKGAARKRS